MAVVRVQDINGVKVTVRDDAYQSLTPEQIAERKKQIEEQLKYIAARRESNAG